MQSHRGFVVRCVAWIIAAALWTGATVGFAQQILASHDEFGNRTLQVDDWQLVIPRMYLDQNTNALWLDWQYPDGTGRGFGMPLDEFLRVRGVDGSSPHHLDIWMKAGVVPDGDSRPYAWDLPGYPLEWTADLIDWWSFGGEGCYQTEGGAWVEFDCPAAASPDQVAATPDPAPACPPGMNPFDAAAAGCRIVVGGGSSPGATMSPEVQQAYDAYNAAKELCERNPTSENCAARDQAYQALTALMGR